MRVRNRSWVGKLGLVVLIVLSQAGCVESQVIERLTNLYDRYRIENNRIQLAMGEKTFSAGKVEIIKAAITGFSDQNISILNIDKELGYVLAEGSGIITGAREKEIAITKIHPEFQEATGIQPVYLPGNYRVRINLNIFERGKESLVKMRLSSVVSSAPGTPTAHQLHPDLIREHFKVLWEAIDKHLFMQKQTSP